MKFKQFSLILKLKYKDVKSYKLCQLFQKIISNFFFKKVPSICSRNFRGTREERKKTITKKKKEITGLFAKFTK